MSGTLYIIVAVLALIAWHRCVAPISRSAAILLLLLPLVFTGPALLRNRAYGPYDLLYRVEPFSKNTSIHNQLLLDLFMQITPWQQQVRNAFARGEWPLWNPAQYAGSVLAGNGQSAPLDPVNLIGMLLPLALATAFGAAMTLFLAALYAFACAREFACSERASLIAAAGYTLSSAMAFNVGWPLGRSWTVLPLTILAVRRVVRDRDRRAFVLLTLAFVQAIVFGHPETALHIVAIGAVFGVFELLPVWRGALRPIVMAIAAGVIALALTAIYVLPLQMSIDAGIEKQLREASQNTDEWAAPPEQLRRAIRATFLPYSGGASWWRATADFELGTARVGSIVLVLAIAASLFLWRRRDARFLSALALFTMLASWKTPLVGKALHALPLFDIALNWRLGFATAWALSLLAAFAFDALASLRYARWIAITVGAALAIATAMLWRPQIAIGVDPRLLVVGAAAELFGLIAVLSALRWPRLAFAILLGALVLQRGVEDGNIYPSVPRQQFYASVPLVDAIPRDPLFRVIGTGSILLPNIGGMYGLDDVRGYDSLRLGRYEATFPLWCPDAKKLYRDVNDLSKPFLSFLGVRYAITPTAMQPPEGWRVVREERGSRLLENTRAIPRVFVPRHIRYNDHEATALEEMKQASDFADVAWIYSNDIPPHTADNGAAELRIARVGTRYEIEVSSASGSRIVITESAWPGWRAYIDGRRVKMQLANHAFLSVGVPAGRHHVRVVYRPNAFVQGRAISIATVVLLLAWAALSRRWRSSPAARTSAGRSHR